jgi:hypothetical protein
MKTPEIDIRQIPLGVNKIINGGFDFWQRGTSFNLATSFGEYTADRFLARKAVVNKVDGLPNIAVGTVLASDACFFLQRLEPAMIQDLYGKKVKVAITMKGSVAGTVVHRSFVNADVNESFGHTEINLTTSYQTFYIDVDFSFFNSSTNINFIETGIDINAGAGWGAIGEINYPIGVSEPSYAGTIDIKSWMLYEATHGELEFQRAGRNYQDEFQLCRRYYEQNTFKMSANAGTTQDSMSVSYFVPKPDIPFVVLSNVTHVNGGVPSTTQLTYFTILTPGGVGQPNVSFDWAANAEL